MNTDKENITLDKVISFNTFNNTPLKNIIKKINKYIGNIHNIPDDQKLLIVIIIIEGIVK